MGGPDKWCEPDPAPRVETGTTEVWLIDADALDPDGLAPLLSPEEHHRAGAFKFRALARRYVAAHGALRHILARYLDADPAALAFARNPWGKPRLADRPLQFNLSHSGPWAALAVSGGEVGIDIETMAAAPPLEVAPLVLSSSERDQLQSAPADRQAALFYGIWTRKEALAKATGQGLSLDLTQITVCAGRFLDVAAIPGGSTWHLAALPPVPGSLGAVATGRPDRVRAWRFSL